MPEYLIVAAAGEYKPGLAVRLQFKMSKKNDFIFIAFIHKKPITFTKACLLYKFDQLRNLFATEYADPREAFNGHIEVEILTASEIRVAIKDYEDFAKAFNFYPKYLKNLKAALQLNPKSDCLVAFETLY